VTGRACFFLLILSAFGVAGIVSISATQTHAAPNSSSPALLYTVAREYGEMAWIRGGERFPAGASIFISEKNNRRPLVPDFYATADASVLFDGKSILFAGKSQRDAHWQIWEVAAEEGRAGKPRQITQCDDDCVRPLPVPPDRLVYAHKAAGKFVLEIASLAAGNEQPFPLTHGAGNFLPVDVLQDGRVLFEAAYTLGENTISELYTVYTDGSGVEAYRCDHGHSRYAGKQLFSEDIVFAREGSLFRFTSALAHEVAVPAPAGTYAGDVLEANDGGWLVSWHAAAQKNFELRKWRTGTAGLLPEVAQPGANVIQPVWLASRAIPNRHPSGLHPWTYANVLCLNAYTSKYKFPDGSIASVRLYTRDAWGASRLLGTAQVEKDGSFYLRVPGDGPLKIELVDGSGNTLKKQAGWFWMRGGEQRVCTGCHAGPETAPENAVPAVLLRSTVPADMTGAGGQSASAGGH
jgi:hypothetical protein